MKIKIFDVNTSEALDASEADRLRYECVLFQVLEACNTRFYMVTNDPYDINTDEAFNSMRRTYWFPACEVRKGDVIQLWTKAGQFSVTPLLDGDANMGIQDTHWHSFYWGLDKCIWNKDKARVTLLEVDALQVVSVKP